MRIYEQISFLSDSPNIGVAILIKIPNIVLFLNERLSGLCNAIELLLFLKPVDIENQLLRARIFIHLGINMEEVNIA